MARTSAHKRTESNALHVNLTRMKQFLERFSNSAPIKSLLGGVLSYKRTQISVAGWTNHTSSLKIALLMDSISLLNSRIGRNRDKYKPPRTPDGIRTL